MKFIFYFILSALCIWSLAVYGWSDFGIVLTGKNIYVSALIFSVILTLVNIFIGTILRFIFLPLSILTLGLFSLLITFFLIKITDDFYSQIEITNFVGYIFIAIIPVFIGMFLGKRK